MAWQGCSSKDPRSFAALLDSVMFTADEGRIGVESPPPVNLLVHVQPRAFIPASYTPLEAGLDTNLQLARIWVAQLS
jgi:hypothetical protein